jgi:predicted RNA-binding Zn-ribbon protein involved in translation (DUF1610 family)
LTVRAAIRCISCDSIIVTRTQIGHKEKQEHSFACPNCGITISFILDLDQRRGRFKFREPHNAKWTDSEAGAIANIAFSDEIPVPVNSPDHFGPFILTWSNFSDGDQYRYDEALRLSWVRSAFPYSERCRVHFERGNWNLFDKESSTSSEYPATPSTRLIALYNCLQGGFSKFTLNSTGKHQRVSQRLCLAKTISPVLYANMANHFHASGMIRTLWTEIGNVRRLLVENYDALQPLIQTRYWDKTKIDLDALILSDKRFNPLRQLYIDCFETLFRLMVPAIGVEAIIHHHAIEIPARLRTIGLDEFQQLDNSNKLDFVRRYPIGDLFTPGIDVQLRNGIGHNSAHFNQERDLVELYDARRPKKPSRTIPYTRFCDALLNLFAAFELAAMYHHDIHIFLEGQF